MNAVKKLFVLTSAMAAMSASGMAVANSPATNHFYVTIRIMPVCEVETESGHAPNDVNSTPSNGADIDFGNHHSNSKQDVQQASQGGSGSGITVKCTKGTPYTIALKPASTSSEDGSGSMSILNDASTDKVAYNLYQDTSYSKKWGSQDGMTVKGVGSGIASPISHAVYGQVAGSELDKTAGRYFDRVAVEVSY